MVLSLLLLVSWRSVSESCFTSYSILFIWFLQGPDCILNCLHVWLVDKWWTFLREVWDWQSVQPPAKMPNSDQPAKSAQMLRHLLHICATNMTSASGVHWGKYPHSIQKVNWERIFHKNSRSHVNFHWDIWGYWHWFPLPTVQNNKYETGKWKLFILFYIYMEIR